MALTSGTKLGPYEIESLIGVGGMGEVYRARDARLNRDVATKILPASFSADSDRLQRFALECRAAAALNHPNILSIWDARFAPDGQTIIYGATWEGAPQEIFSTRFDSSDSRSVGLPSAQIFSISSKGEMAICLHPVNFAHFIQTGTLARVPLAGGAPREVIDNVHWAPDGQSLAIIRLGTSNLSHLEYPPGNVIYEPRNWVSHVRFSPSGEFLAIADHVAGGDDGRIVIVDTHGNRKASSSFYTSVAGLAWSPNGKEVWFPAVPGGSARSIYALDLSGKERLIYRAPGGLTLHWVGFVDRGQDTPEHVRVASGRDP
jgi:hypothetical protein